MVGFLSNRKEEPTKEAAKATGGRYQRLSVRGAFGPTGSLWQERRRSSELLSRAQIFKLDTCR